jgi:hypothetical protein
MVLKENLLALLLSVKKSVQENLHLLAFSQTSYVQNSLRVCKVLEDLMDLDILSLFHKSFNFSRAAEAQINWLCSVVYMGQS